MRIYFLFLPMLILLSGCPAKKDPAPEFSISSNMKKCIRFGDGSYWIYKNTESELIDTVKVVFTEYFKIDNHYNIDKDKVYSDLEYYYDYYNVTYESSYFKSEYDGSTGSIVTTYSEFHPLYPVISTIYHDNIKNEFELDSGVLKRELIDELTLNGLTFNNVKKFYSTENQHPKKIKYSFFVPEIGLIKKEFYDGNIWELVDYKIVNYL